MSEITFRSGEALDGLLNKLDLLHTTKLGAARIRANLCLDTEDVVQWCKEKILKSNDITRKGKNWYIVIDDIRITVNAHSLTIITAHKEKLRRRV